jgi:glycosyltransferase involved in cell wall biosynthesis
VNTPPEKIKENLKALIENPELRRELGMAGRRYVERHHSLEAVGGILNKIYHNVWFGEEADCVRGNCFKEKRFSEGRTLL